MSATAASNTSVPTVNTVTPVAVVAPVVPAAVTPSMTSESCTLGSFAHLPMLSKDNYQNWQHAVKAYLMGYRHVRVITRMRDAMTGALVTLCIRRTWV